MSARPPGTASLRLALVLVLAPALHVAPPAALAQPTCALPHVAADGTFEHAFVDGNNQPATAWRATVSVAEDSGLVITEASFRTGPGAPWTKVVGDARVAEIFVPYHTGQPRFYDTNYFSLVPMSQKDLGACGQLFGGGYIAMENRDRGVLWKQYQNVRRGRDITVWATMGAGNYNYLIAFSFLDEGTIEMRAAGTAQNLPSKEYESHTHTVLWRIDPDIAGAGGDTPFIRRHVEPSGGPLRADDVLEKVNGGKEGALDFNEHQFNEIRIVDAALNPLGRPIAYDLRPVKRGLARHHGSGEDFARHDAWVLRAKPSELLVRALPSYADGEGIDNADIAVWVQSPLHHEPRDEDGFYRGGNWFGVALAMWGGVDLRPRNLFAGTPYYP
jgi:primary-amine oxidase